MTTPPLAQSIVYRESEYRFEVDGAKFPWLISDAGPKFIRHGDAVLVTVETFPLDPDSYEYLPFSHTYGEPGTIGGRAFPWAVTGEVIYRHSPRDAPTLTLTFVAENIDADIDIPESPAA